MKSGKWGSVPGVVKVVIVLAVVACGVLLAAVPMARTSKMEYCMTCHEMNRYKAELEKSPHAVDADKNPIECAQCHIPQGVGPKYVTVKVLSGLTDVWVHNFGDPENLDRRQLQDRARRFIDDDNCLACHPDLTLTAKNDPKIKISEVGRLSHEAYLGTNGTTKRGCAGCHFNMAHLPDFDRRYGFNQTFSQNLKPVQE